jgi:hypothetical protein
MVTPLCGFCDIFSTICLSLAGDFNSGKDQFDSDRQIRSSENILNPTIDFVLDERTEMRTMSQTFLQKGREAMTTREYFTGMMNFIISSKMVNDTNRPNGR